MFQLFLIFAVIFVSSLIYSLTGFGYSLVAVPLLTMFVSPQIAIPVIIFLGVLMSIYLLLSTLKEVDFIEIVYLILGAIPGVPIGTFILAKTDPLIIKILVNILVILSVFCFLRKRELITNFVNFKFYGVAAGFMSGVLGSSSGISGPPVIIFGMSKGWNKIKFRANLVWYFGIWASYSLINFFLIGLIDESTFVKFSVAGIFGLFLGIMTGKRVHMVVSEEFFSKLCLVLFLSLAFLGLCDAVRNLIFR